jgi:hypothetical protein
MHFRQHFFLYILVPLVVLMAIASYYRFMVAHDYVVEYEGDCDPVTQNCFVGCDDDECTEEYYYSRVQKYAADVNRECGPDITDCESAMICLPDERSCSITYCNAETVGEDEVCETISGTATGPADEDSE